MPDLKLYYRAIVIKTAWYWYYNRQVDQLNRIKDQEMNPHTYGHLIFDKGAKTIQLKKDSIFNKWCWHNWQLSCRSIQIDIFLSPCTKVKSKWIKKLHIKSETVKLREEKVGKSLEYPWRESRKTMEMLGFFPPLDGFSSLVKDQVTIGVWVHFMVFSSIPLVYLSVAVPVLCSF